ncbi:MAG: hypothetical protein IKK10_03345 [Clostridia bacterium]|nr:hypothetical protein [Clostridia bacterium]
MRTIENYSHNIGEMVVYRKQGIYEITGIKEQIIGGAKKDYYVLSSVYDKNATVYVPVDSESLVSQMEPMLSKDEIHAIIDISEENSVNWLENTAERALYFDEIMKSGDLTKILAMLKMFILRKESADKKSNRTFARDEKVYAAAQKAVTEAFAYPLGIDKTQVIPYITDRVNSNL